MEVDVFVHLPRRHIDAGAAEAGDAAHQRIDHGLHEGRGDRGVDGVSAGPHRLDAGLGRLRLRRHHHSAFER